MSQHLNLDEYRVKPHEKHPLRRIASDADGGLDKDKTVAKLVRLRARLDELQELLYADGRFAVLLVLQGMDTAGKDSTIRQVFEGVNPQGVCVTSFKAPNTTEAAHDFLWRIHQSTPRRGTLTVFNRSHYEDVLIVRVKNLVPKERWKKRYDHINAFEKMLTDEGTVIVKCCLHISKDFQKKRLQARLDDPAKHWKFDPADLVERGRWDDYQKAYHHALTRCSTNHAPWYLIPAEHRWFRNLLIAQLLVDRLEALHLRYPKPTFDPKKIVVK